LNSSSKCAGDAQFFEDNKAAAGLGMRSVRGGVIAIVARGTNAIVQVGSIFLLARLLAPADYGLVAMVIAITGFAPIFVDLGTRDAIVQRDRITPADISMLFWLTVSVGFVGALLVAASGPLIAAFYREPRLIGITLVASLTFVTTSLSCQHYALMRRTLMFRQLSLLEIAANVGGAAVAIGMAYQGSGYWALVTRPLVTASVLAAGVWWFCAWRPEKPRWSESVKQMLKFGLHLTGFTMTDFAGRSVDRIAIGYVSGAANLGFYQNSLMVYENALELLTNPLHGVAIAALSKLRENLIELKRSWAKALSALAFVAMPLFGALAIGGYELVVLVLGSKWAYSGVLLSILALRGMAHVVERTLGWLHVIAGRTDRWMRWGVISTLLQFVALACGLPFGPMGIVIAFTIHSYVLFVPAIVYAGKPLGIGAADVVRAVGPQLLGTLTAYGVTLYLKRHLITATSGLIDWLAVGVLFAAVYLAIVVGLFRVRKPFWIMVSLMNDVVARVRNLRPQETAN
jgi:polysaccharide transporter, PST family